MPEKKRALVKGTLAIADKQAASTCVHAMETSFVRVRDGKLRLSKELFDLAFASLDQLTRTAEQNTEDVARFQDLARQWTALAESSDGEAAHGMVGIPFALASDEADNLRRVLAAGKKLCLIEKSIYGDGSRDDYERLPIYEDIERLGMLVARHPHFEDLDRRKHETVLLLLVATDLDVERMREEIFDPMQALSLSEADKKSYLTAAKPRLLRSLIVEDDFISRLLLQKFLAPFGESHVAVDGEEAVLAVTSALDAGQPYQLICLDIMMPKLDGQGVLRALRESEEKHGIPLGKGAKVIMTTCLKDAQNIMAAFRGQCDVYMVKPIARAKLLDELRKLDLGAF